MRTSAAQYTGKAFSTRFFHTWQHQSNVCESKISVKVRVFISACDVNCAYKGWPKTPTDGGCPYDIVFAKFMRLRILEMAFRCSPDVMHLVHFVSSIYDILVRIPEPTLEQMVFHLDFSGYIGAAGHDIAQIRPLMADKKLYAKLVEDMKTVEERPCFSRLVSVEVLLHFRYDHERWDKHTAKIAGEYFLERMYGFFFIWESRGIFRMSCSDAMNGTYNIPRPV